MLILESLLLFKSDKRLKREKNEFVCKQMWSQFANKRRKVENGKLSSDAFGSVSFPRTWICLYLYRIKVIADDKCAKFHDNFY